MDKFVGIILGVVVLSIIVVAHELGHFLFAKLNGIAVEEFALGMGPKILKKKFGETEFSLRAFPIGGLCKMIGEDEIVDNESSFSAKSVWARIQVVLGGALFNFILAFLVAIIYIANVETRTTVVEVVGVDTPAEKAGLIPGDKIVEINGKNIISYTEIPIYINEGKGREIELSYKREGLKGKTAISIVPYLSPEGNYRIGFSAVVANTDNFFQIVKYAGVETVLWIKMVFYGLSQMVTGVYRLDDLSGPVGLFDVTGDGYEQAVQHGIQPVLRFFMFLTVFLSANLGVMNLLPIPALDGGRFIFLLIEAVRGKPINQDKEAFVHFVGFVLLMMLMVVVMFNDIRKIF